MEPSNPDGAARPLHVTIVSDNPETLDGLEAYLRRAGVATNGTKHVERLPEMMPAATSVVLLFPDDFQHASVLSALATLRAERPKILPVLVTKEPKRFQLLTQPKTRQAGAVVPLIVPKPVWGWAVLDAIRTRLEAGEQESS